MPKLSKEELEKYRSISYKASSPSNIKEYKSEKTGRIKETTDEAGNTVIQHSKGDRQDVVVRPQVVQLTSKSSLGE